MHDTLRPPTTQKKGGGRLASRNASMLAATVAAALAALLIVVFLQKYRNDLSARSLPVSALVADSLIQKGASAETAGAQGQFSVAKLPREQVKAGALADAAALKGQVAVDDILPGQQLTPADFKAAGNGLVTKLGPDDRAVSIALDAQHSLGGQLVAGDHVDVLSGLVLNSGSARERPVLKTLMQNILVLSVPGVAAPAAGTAGGAGAAGVTLRVSSRTAGILAYAADHGQVWLSLRALDGRSVAQPPLVTVDSLLAERSVPLQNSKQVAR
jgi:Flp pilus assembly protein CpaB